jgi:hypothetical protein
MYTEGTASRPPTAKGLAGIGIRARSAGPAVRPCGSSSGAGSCRAANKVIRIATGRAAQPAARWKNRKAGERALRYIFPAVRVLAAPSKSRRGGRTARLESEPCATSFLAGLPARATENAIAARITGQSCRTQRERFFLQIRPRSLAGSTTRSIARVRLGLKVALRLPRVILHTRPRSLLGANDPWGRRASPLAGPKRTLCLLTGGRR